MRLHAVIFDLDGTLADSMTAVAATANAALREHGLPVVPAASVHALVGLPLDDMMARLVPEAHRSEAIAVADRYRALYRSIAAETERLFPGVVELLDGLRGRPLAIATGKSQDGADHATARLGLRPWFRAIHGILPGTPGKPDPALLRRALADLGARPDEAVVVGDTVYDLQMARAAGVAACAVTWGCHSREALAAERPDAVVDDLAALAAFLG